MQFLQEINLSVEKVAGFFSKTKNSWLTWLIQPVPAR